MQIKLYPLKNTPNIVTQYRELLRLSGIIHQEEQVELNNSTGWKVTTSKAYYTDQYLSWALLKVIRAEVMEYVLTRALWDYYHSSNNPYTKPEHEGTQIDECLCDTL